MLNSQFGLTRSRMRCTESIGSELDCVTVLLCPLWLCIITVCLSRLKDRTAANAVWPITHQIQTKQTCRCHEQDFRLVTEIYLICTDMWIWGWDQQPAIDFLLIGKWLCPLEKYVRARLSKLSQEIYNISTPFANRHFSNRRFLLDFRTNCAKFCHVGLWQIHISCVIYMKILFTLHIT